MMLLVLVLLAADPPGTITLDLEAGTTAPIHAKSGANVICDDLSVVTAEFADDGFLLRALKPGSTLCGVWFADQVPGGLYRVNVTVPEAPDAGSKADSGSP